ncbi:MAG: hypothetical protein E6X99_23095 [Pantoea sp.]|nr:hypothetical protein [Pantoea sp.]
MLGPELKQTLDKAAAGAAVEHVAQDIMDSLGCGEPPHIKAMREAGLTVPPRESPIDKLLRLGVLKRIPDEVSGK